MIREWADQDTHDMIEEALLPPARMLAATWDEADDLALGAGAPLAGCLFQHEVTDGRPVVLGVVDIEDRPVIEQVAGAADGHRVSGGRPLRGREVTSLRHDASLSTRTCTEIRA
jgi:hypothetical protein